MGRLILRSTAVQDAEGPTAPTITATAASSSTVTVTRTIPATDVSGILNYETQRSPAGAGTWTTVDTSNTSPLTVGGLSSATAYDFRQRAIDNLSNVGTFSSVVSATTLSGGSSLVDGQAFSVIGGTFGTRPDYNDGDYTFSGVRHIHKRFTRFENPFPTNGSSRATFESDANGKGFIPAGLGFAFASTPSAEGLSIQTGGPSSSGKYLRKLGDTFADAGYIQIDINCPTPADIYICYKARGGDGAKIWRLWHDDDSHDVFLGTGGIFRDDRGSGSWPYDGTAFFSGASTGFQDSATTWNRHELILSVANQSRFRCSGTVVSCEVYIGGNPTTDSTIPMVTSADNGQAVHMTWPNSVDSGIAREYADMYVDFTAARVEVSNGGKTEVQPLSSWAAGQINGVFNKGELSAGSATLRVYSASDAVIHTASVTVA